MSNTLVPLPLEKKLKQNFLLVLKIHDTIIFSFPFRRCSFLINIKTINDRCQRRSVDETSQSDKVIKYFRIQQ